ncbi:MAG: AMP-binding protein [Desulfobacteraceae bacterium]|jgi:long-chain acyl-CoA synthetase|nr:AMP-binding protein [Desulfobacteraceae bacterium]
MKSIDDQRPWLKLYPQWLAHELEVPESTALDDFKASVVSRGDSPAVCYFDNKISYAELDRISSGLATAFADLGVGKGDRILVDLQNVPQFPVVTYGAWKAGAIVVPVNPMYREKELTYFCNDSGAKVFVTLDEIAGGLDLSFLKETSVRTTITTSPLDFLPRGKEAPALLEASTKIPIPGAMDMLALAEKYKDKEPCDPALQPEDIAYLTYTSGTTGPPKGAMNTHGNIAFNARVYKAALRMDEDDVVLGVAPLFHVTGEVAHLAIAALVGIPLVLYYRFDPAETLRLIERWNITMSVASITVYIALMNHPDIRKRDLSSFVKAYSGGAPVSSAIVDQFEELTGLYIYNAYGMTETNSPTHLVPLGLRAPVDPESGALSVGVPVPNTVVKIMDLEEGNRELGPGEVGEIVDYGPMVIPGYWQKPEETKHAIRDGWMYTGDVGKKDKDGWFYVVDRKKDMIVASGYKVWPRDVEDVIYQHPAVKETAVIGVPDPYRVETVKAFVALKEGWENAVTPEEIVAFCKSRMAAYKYPRHVEIVPEIPKTLTGKFLRRTLREQKNPKDAQ